MTLAAAAERIAAQFEYPRSAVQRGVHEFLREMKEGLRKSGTTLSQLPSYVTAVPDGSEKGVYMAVDLGGTNFRVCSIRLHGNGTFSLTQEKTKVPAEMMLAKTGKELFGFMADRIEAFLKTHHEAYHAAHVRRRTRGLGYSDEEMFSLGFTFSFPVEQQGINKGTLIRWTKGFDIPDVIGKDVCSLLQTEIDARYLPVRVVALVNDTVGTLLARAYTNTSKNATVLGAIFGTGTNGAYVEKLDRILKMSDASDVDRSTGDMIINTEWGSFDNPQSVLPVTSYDIQLDQNSVNPGVHMFEKRVSGLFLGEILRRALLELVKDPSAALFSDENSNQNDTHSTTNIAASSPLYEPFGLDTSLLSLVAGDDSKGLKITRQALDGDYGISAASAEDAEAVRLIAAAIGKRAARLAAVAIAAIVIHTNALRTADQVDVGVDGSLVEFYPNFEDYVREALREIAQIGESGEKRIHIGIAKDGSGVGAALCALVAEAAQRGKSSAVLDCEMLTVAEAVNDEYEESDNLFSRLIGVINDAVRLRV
ncbi:hypothetical protein K470DRAFT_259121 [Piedraia hortae CBS 480.64]|uniref:Phosphotransferase n=1 Tax=Piedraia hortae CBS 480.64 TaxID=1314780 RepID=A0A6A7BX61_9PEZI|nr:hypothetical protein K470DRAFT_259121 [Piedraia hortae CBS 480.64]